MSDYSMADFRAELGRRGVYKNGKPVQTAAERKKPRGRQGGRRESWPKFVERTVEAARNQIALLMRHDAAVRLPDPRDWNTLITVGQLRDRYRELVEWLEALR